ncbi:hypothetical protein [Nesterenkonia ebinurensis]|uniref:hypothetical protein n=1 Tax=Nesterenkonia ebinurensis TaxID=2608252 RepID=UPI00123E0A4C|nr:hypothetical protein [Nesterenkonia ebinurensis]
MRILSLDYEPLFGDEYDTASTFESDISVFDYDIVIWDPEASIQGYSYYDHYQGLPSLTDQESARLKADVDRRRAEFREYVESGRTLIVVARPPQTRFVATGEVRTSGTGRNATRVRVVAQLDIMSAIPAPGISFTRASGDRISVVGRGPLQDHLRVNAKHLRYAATMASAPGSTIATVTGMDRIVASVLRTKAGGTLAMMPPTSFKGEWDEDGENQDWPDEAPAFQVSLIDALIALDGLGEVERPVWADRFTTQNQVGIRAAVVKQEAAIERARKKLSALQAERDAADLRDQLYLGSGRVLELQVKDVLQLLGGEVSEPEPNRDDWRVDFDGTPAVVEIKGVTKSAAEKHAAQLEKWVAGALADTETAHKGILIVNTWRDLPLDERTDEDFPAQMIPYSTGRKHALITGLELFVIAADIEADPKKAKYWRDKALSTSGRLTDVPDWRGFIQEITTGNS